MKKTIILTLTLALLLALSACALPTGNPTNNETENTPRPSDEQVVQKENEVPQTPKEEAGVSEQPQKEENQKPAETPKNEQPQYEVPQAPSQAPKEESAPSQPSAEENTQKPETKLISRQNAIDIALQAAGLSANAVFEIDAELDREPYGTYWEVDFETREREYSYEIDAVTSKIVHQKSERND